MRRSRVTSFLSCLHYSTYKKRNFQNLFYGSHFFCAGRHRRSKVGGCHKIDVMCSPTLELRHYLCYTERRDTLTDRRPRYFTVLAINTSERASREEDSTRAPLARNDGLLPHMEVCSCDLRHVTRTAVSDTTRGSVNTASACTQCARGVIFTCILHTITSLSQNY